MRWEKNSEGSFAGACSEYRDLQEFEELFREHFRDFLAGQVERESGQKVSGRKVRWKSSPFRGLNFFDFEHAPIFHGRTKAIGEVLEALEVQAGRNDRLCLWWVRAARERAHWCERACFRC